MKKHILSLTGAVCIALMLTGCINKGNLTNNTKNNIDAKTASSIMVPTDSDVVISFANNDTLNKLVGAYEEDVTKSIDDETDKENAETMLKVVKDFKSAVVAFDTDESGDPQGIAVNVTWKSVDNLNTMLEKMAEEQDLTLGDFKGTPTLQFFQAVSDEDENANVDGNTLMITADDEATKIVDNGKSQYMTNVTDKSALTKLSDAPVYKLLAKGDKPAKTLMSIAAQGEILSRAKDTLDAKNLVAHVGLDGELESMTLGANVAMDLGTPASETTQQLLSGNLASCNGEANKLTDTLPPLAAGFVNGVTYTCTYKLTDEAFTLTFVAENINNENLAPAVRQALSAATTSIAPAPAFDDTIAIEPVDGDAASTDDVTVEVVAEEPTADAAVTVEPVEVEAAPAQ